MSYPDEEYRAKLRKLEHDVKNCLSVVSMGMLALEGARQEPEDFAEVYATIHEGGIEPLKQGIAELVELASSQHVA